MLIVEIPSPDTYNIKTCFDGTNLTIKKNNLTTDFNKHSARKHHDKVYVPGARSPRQMEFVPGPGTYTFFNQTLGTEGSKFTMKSRIRNVQGNPIV
jgi:hypothetical protein